jgi:hypothetical protein
VPSVRMLRRTGATCPERTDGGVTCVADLAESLPAGDCGQLSPVFNGLRRKRPVEWRWGPTREGDPQFCVVRTMGA